MSQVLTEDKLVDHGPYYRPKSIFFQVSSSDFFSCPVVYPLNLVSHLEKPASSPQVIHILPRNCGEEKQIDLPLDHPKYCDLHLVPYIKSEVATQGGFNIKIKECLFPRIKSEVAEDKRVIRMECTSCKCKPYCGFHFFVCLRVVNNEHAWCLVQDGKGSSLHQKRHDSVEPELHKSTSSRHY